MSELYFRELFVYHGADFVKTVAGLLFFAAGIVAILLLSLEILGTCLTWREIIPITGELTAGDFGDRLIWLRDYQYIGIILFAACIGTIILYLILALKQRPPETKKPGKNTEGGSALWQI